MRRIAVVGGGGAGKTTLSLELGRRLALSVVHLDAVFWQPGWAAPDRDQWVRDHAASLAADAWVADGNYGSTMEERFGAADTIVFLDAHPAVCLWRVVRRQVRWFGRTRPDLAPGCVERFDVRETIVFWRYVLGFRRRRRPLVLARIERHADGKRVEILRTRRDLERFLASLPP